MNLSIVVGDPIDPFTDEDVTRAEKSLVYHEIEVVCPYMETRHLAKILFNVQVCENKIIRALRGDHHPNFTYRRDLT